MGKDDAWVRLSTERWLRKTGYLPRGSHLVGAWAVTLLSLQIDGIEVEEGERGGRLARAARPVAGTASSLALSNDVLMLRTPSHTYSAAAGNVIGAEAEASIVKLLWTYPRAEAKSVQAWTLPEGAPIIDGVYVFQVRADAISDQHARHLVDQIAQRRAAQLVMLDPVMRAYGERLIQGVSELGLD